MLRPLPRISYWTARWGSVLALLAAAFLLAPVANAATPAEEFVQRNIDKGYSILNNVRLSDSERRAQFRDFMLSLTDTRRIGLFTLGPYVRGASEAELEAFHDAFVDYAVAVYESRLSKYKGQTLKVTNSTERAPDDIIVYADVVNPNAAPGVQPIRVAFRVRKASDGRWIITDMQVEGVWLALSQRSDFTGFLQRNRGSIPALTQHLRTQAQQVLVAPAAPRG